MLNPTQLTALQGAVSAAKICEQQTKCPAALTVAQWALESGWGSHSPGNNCFGIKEYKGCCATQELVSYEYVDGKEVQETELFAVFPTLAACFEFHALLITTGAPYSAAFELFEQTSDLDRLIEEIAPIYAPGNESYAGTLLKILQMQEVLKAL